MENNKICTSCNIKKGLDEFSKQKLGKYGVRSTCKVCTKIKTKVYYDNNLEKELKRGKKFYYDNIEEERKRSRDYRTKNLDKSSESKDNWRKNNPNYDKEYKLKHKSYINERNKKRKKNNVLFKLSCVSRSMVSNSLRKNGYSKTSKTNELLGCSFKEFKSHIEEQWSLENNLNDNDNGYAWMNWSNYGTPNNKKWGKNKNWELDHIIPLSSAKTEDELIRLLHYSNVQPLCTNKNRSLGNKGFMQDPTGKYMWLFSGSR